MHPLPISCNCDCFKKKSQEPTLKQPVTALTAKSPSSLFRSLSVTSFLCPLLRHKNLLLFPPIDNYHHHHLYRRHCVCPMMLLHRKHLLLFPPSELHRCLCPCPLLLKPKLLKHLLNQRYSGNFVLQECFNIIIF